MTGISYRAIGIGSLFASLTIGVCSAQTITSFAGTGDFGFSGDSGPARLASLAFPGPMALDGAGGLYIMDGGNWRVRRVTSDGVIQTVAGSGDISSPVEGPANQSGFISLYSLAVSPSGVLHLADADGMQRVDSQGNLVFEITGQGVLNIAISNQGVSYLGDVSTVSRLEVDGSVTLLAGADVEELGDGGPATQAGFNVTALTTDRLGNIFILDNVNNRVRKFVPGGMISTVAGNGTFDFTGDGGPSNQAALANPSGIAVDVAGNVYISDTSNHRVRKVALDGTIATFAGQDDSPDAGDDGPALQAHLDYPANLAVSCTALYVMDTNRIRAIGLITPLVAQAGVVSITTSSATVRAGEMFTISGCNLSSLTAKADLGFTLPTTLGGATVTVGGVPVPLVSVSPTQIMGQLPAGISAGTSSLVVTVGAAGQFVTNMTVN